ncbi:hypothetical protein CR513_61335, partial [Mucuna pruriens]
VVRTQAPTTRNYDVISFLDHQGISFKELRKCKLPPTTNYDVGSPSWGVLRLTPLLSAMKVINLGYRPSCSPIDPV